MSDYKLTRDAAGKVTTQYDKMLRNLDDDDLVKRARAAWKSGNDFEAMGLIKSMADRIEELEANLAEQIEWVKSLADELIAAEGREARLKANLEKVKEFVSKLEQYAIAIDDTHLHGKAVATLAELTGGKTDE